MRASQTLFGDWVRPSTGTTGTWLHDTASEPGAIALRARWHYLRSLGDEPAFRGAHAVSYDQWQQEIDLESEGDLALIQMDLVTAKSRFAALLAGATHPVVQVQALIGLADVERLADRLEDAREGYEEAGRLAEEIGFLFGSMRAQLPLAYLVRRGGSAELMLQSAQQCEASARTLGDAVYIANAQIAQGEALDLLGRSDMAIAVLGQAMAGFADLDVPVGVASAGIRLADVYRRREDAHGILSVAPVVLRATQQSHQLQETVDLYDLLAFAHTALGEFEQALQACRNGIAAAGSKYPRSVAHLRMSEGTALRKSGSPEEAVQSFLAALEYFDSRPDDNWMVPYCLGHIAGCLEDLDEMGQAVQLRRVAVERMEQVRAAQIRPQWQQEYRDRFNDVYRGALLAAVRADDPATFAAVFESLLGRRLVGLSEEVAFEPNTDPLLLAQLLARNEQARRAPEDPDRRSRDRWLGRMALAGALPENYLEATQGTLAAAYRPVTADEADVLLDQVNQQVALLLICELPRSPGQLAWLAHRPGDRYRLGVTTLSDQAQTSMATWSSGTWPRTGTAQDITELAGLIPEALVGLPEGARLQIVPIGALWSIPWSALPWQGKFLGSRHSLSIAPSLTLAKHTGNELGAALPAAGTVVCRIGPGVGTHDLRGLGKVWATATAPGSAEAAHRSLMSGSVDAVVIAAHGRPTPGLGHYLELAHDVLLTPTELLLSQPPAAIALLACWGARTLEPATGEPLTLGTIAFARGSRQILTTVAELGDGVLARAVVNETLSRATQQPWGIALRETLCHREADLRDAPLIHWAALTTIGSW